MDQRKYEVHSEDANGDVWIVGTDSIETAKALADQQKRSGHINVRIVTNEHPKKFPPQRKQP